MTLSSFEDSYSSIKRGRIRLLLGNGFSQACDKNAFSWSSIFESAKLSQEQRQLFIDLNTTDFERVIKSLQDAARAVEVYAPADYGLIRRLQEEADSLKGLLAEAIAENHPPYPSVIPNRKFTSCIRFLSKFENVYTLNYDLLLYWTYLKSMDGSLENLPSLKSDDGFRDAPGEDYVTWEGDWKQNIYYLHGALHLFVGPTKIRKSTWCRTKVSLLEQLQECLADDIYPMFVAEGEGSQKVGQILRNGYLSKCFRSLQNQNGNLFIFGASLSERDAYLIEAIGRYSTIQRLYVGIFGDENSEANSITRATAESAKELRRETNSKNGGRTSLDVFFYDAGSINPWESFSTK